MLAGQRDRSRPSGSAHQFRVVLYSNDSSWGRTMAARKNDRQSAQAVAVLRVRGWGSKKRNPFSVHQSLTLCEAAPPGHGVNYSRPSPPEPELGDNRPVALDVGALQVVQ